MQTQELNFQVYKATNLQELETLEKTHRPEEIDFEVFPFTQKTSYIEVADKIIKDKAGEFKSPIYLSISEHNSIIGAKNLAKKAFEFMQNEQKEVFFDMLSIAVNVQDLNLKLYMLIRLYDEKSFPNLEALFKLLGEDIIKKQEEEKKITGQIIIPEEVKRQYPTEDDIRKHDEAYRFQAEIIKNTPKNVPFLNKLSSYVPSKVKNPEEHADLIYDLETKDRALNTITEYKMFSEIFNNAMAYISGIEYNSYILSLSDEGEKKPEIMNTLKNYLTDNYIKKATDGNRLAKEDLQKMLIKLERALYQLYIVQDFINDPNISDVNITNYNEVRVRHKGKTYLSNVSFVNLDDYYRFVNMICVRNNILRNVPSQTFTDQNDPNYILRFTISSEYANSVNYPYLGIRKIPREKLMAPELMAAGMFDEKIRDYLIDCGKTSRGVVFAGPPGSGKTYILNWFLEDAYEQSADILIIQENDELFPIRKGVKCQHVVQYPQNGAMPVDLEELGRLALVANANVFIIGEAKGPEICSAITLSNSGCRTALTIHSNSSTETIDKMADLALRGYAKDIVQAKRMIKSFQTIVYMQDFKVQEITEITGYDEDKKDMIYRSVYRRES